MTDTIEHRAVNLLYQVACDLEREVIERGGHDSPAVQTLELWRAMDVSLAEYKELATSLKNKTNKQCQHQVKGTHAPN